MDRLRRSRLCWQAATGSHCAGQADRAGRLHHGLSLDLLTVVADVCTDLLILVQGRREFFGTLPQAQARYGVDDLEALFFQATGT